MDGYRKLFSAPAGSSGLTMTSVSPSPYSPSTVMSAWAPTTCRLLLLLFFVIVAEVSLQAHERTLSKQETFSRRCHRQWNCRQTHLPHRTDEHNQGQGAQALNDGDVQQEMSSPMELQTDPSSHLPCQGRGARAPVQLSDGDGAVMVAIEDVKDAAETEGVEAGAAEEVGMGW